MLAYGFLKNLEKLHQAILSEILHIGWLIEIILGTIPERLRSHVNHCALNKCVTQLVLNHDQARPTIQQIGGKRMPQ